MRGPESPLSSAVSSFMRSEWRLRDSTKRSYRASLQRLLRFGLERLAREPTVADLGPELANRYLASVVDHHTMARNDAIAIKRLATWLVSAGIRASDPLAGVTTPRVARRRRKPFDDCEVPAIIRIAGESKLGARDRAIVVLGLSTALRPSELRMLRWPDDLDLEEGFVYVRGETKTDAGERVVPLDPQAIRVLDDYISDYRPDTPGPLFVNNHGDAFTYWGFLQVFYRLRNRLRREGIFGYQAYRMRHTGITNWNRVGIQPADMQQLAGHKDFATTRGYIGHRSKKELARLPRAFSEVYGRAVS